MTPADAPRDSQRGLPFVGRWAELSLLSELGEEARAGQPRIALIVGDAGVGKSTLAREMVADLDDARLAAGRCRETMRLAYSPFRDSLFPMLADHLAANPGESRYRDLIDQLTDSITSPVGDASELEAKTHQRLVDAAVVAVDLASEQLLVVVVDDLHWADEATLALFEALTSHVADASLSGDVPVLMVATMRPPDDDAHRAALERLAREPIATKLLLEGLPRLDLAAFAHAVAGRALTDRELTELLDATDGNPLYAEAVLLHGRGQHLPVHIRDAIGAPIEKLTPDVRATLEAASFFDDQFTAVDLAEIAGRGRVEVTRDLDEATLARVVEQADDAWQFTHPLYRRLFHEAATPSAAQRIHAAIAGLLAASGDEADVRAVAQHLARAGDEIDDEAVVRSSFEAGKIEFLACNWARACEHYTVVLDRLTRGAATEVGIDEAQVHYDLAQALVYQGEVGQGVDHHLEAARRFEAQGDAVSNLQVLVNLCQIQVTSGDLGDTVEDADLRRALDAVRLESPSVAAEAMATIGQTHWVAGRLDEAVEAAEEAIRLAHEGDMAEIEVMARVALAMVAWTRFEPRTARRELEHASQLAAAASHPARRVGAINRLPLTLLWLGETGEARAVAERAVEVGEALRFRRELGLPVTTLAMLDTLRGDVLHAEHLVQRALTIDRLTSYSWASVFARPLLAVICDLHGRTDDADEALVDLEAMMGSGSNWTRAARLLHLASWARRGERIDLDRAPVGLDPSVQASIGVSGLAAAHVALADATREPGVADGAVEILQQAQQRGLVYVASLGVLVDRSLGRALALAGRTDDAIEVLEHALERARADGAAIEVARTSRDLANTLRDRMAAGDDSRAAVMHDDHVRICQALGLRGLLAVPPTPLAPAPGSSADLHAAVVMIVDICDSTVLAGRLGDVAYAQEVRSVLDRVYARVAQHGGRVVNHTGDGALVSFDDASAALDCALACHAAVRSARAALHFGVHAGDVVELDGNLFGVAVNTAARLCDQARSGETVISDAVRELVGAGSHRYEDRGVPTLKGVADDLQLFAVGPA